MQKSFFTLIMMFTGLVFAQQSQNLPDKVVADFYHSLELSGELNAQHAELGNVKFDLSNFKIFLMPESSYSSKRIELLSDPLYHDRANIELIEIRDIVQCQTLNVAFCLVKYDIYELGSFICLELVTFNSDNKLISWCDVNVVSLDIAEYIEDFSAKDVYELIGENCR